MKSRFGKKAMAVLLVAIMVMTMLPISAFADADGSYDQIVENGTSGTQLFDSKGNDPVDDNEMVEINKTIAGTDVEDEFLITLEVRTRTKIEELVITEDSTAVLVIDISGSMNYCLCKNSAPSGSHTAGCAGRTRLAVAKEAAQTFLTTYAASGRDESGAVEAARWISIVTFSQGAAVIQGWADVSVAATETAVAGIIRGIAVGGNGTNIEAGLLLARNQQNTRNPDASITNNNVILLSDGAPNYFVKGANNTTGATAITYSSTDILSQVTSDGGNGTDIRENAAAGAIARVGELKAKPCKVYTIAFSAGATGATANWLRDSIASSPAESHSALDSATLALAFQEISRQIEFTTTPWTVTDPMGDYIVWNGLDTLSAGALAAFAGNTLTWNLENEVWSADADKPGWRVYKLTYKIKLDTAADGFEENKPYDTNGETTLFYVSNESGTQVDQATVEFDVPQVKGEFPSYGYTINFFRKNKGADGYTKIDADTITDTAKLGAAVTPTDYVNKYIALNYSFEKGDPLSIAAIVKDSDQNVINLYYIPDTTSVTVNHYLTTITKTLANPAGVTTGPSLIAGSPLVENGLFVGDEYTADFLTGYTKDNDYANDNVIEALAAAGADNVINLYYITTIDERVDYPYEAHYFYTTKEWQLVDGEYALVTTQDREEATSEKITGSQKEGTTYTAPDKPNGYTPESIDSSSGTREITISSTAANNIVNIYYVKTIGERGDPATLTVNHHYTTETVSGTNTEHNYGTARDVYIGETYTIPAELSFDGNDYGLATGQDAPVIKTIVLSEEVVDIYYYRDIRIETEVIVNHYYDAYKWEIDEFGDAQLVLDNANSSRDEDNVLGGGPYFIGGSATASAQNKAGFTALDSNEYTLNDLKQSGNVINLYYESIPEDLEGGAAQVKHVYNTYTTYVNGEGVLVTGELSTENHSEDVVTGNLGEWFNAVPAPEYGGNTFNQISPAEGESLKVTLTNPTNIFTITYERRVNLLEEAVINVQPIYVTYNRIVDTDGVTMLVEASRIEDADPFVENTLMAGQFFTAKTSPFTIDGSYGDYSEYAAYGFDTALTVDNYTDIKLVAGDNGTVELFFSRVVDVRAEEEVVVIHHYEYTKWVVEDGVYTPKKETAVDTKDPVPAYVNEFFTAAEQTIFGGKTYDRTTEDAALTIQVIDGENEVHIYYVGESIDTTTPVTYRVDHVYTLRDWDNSIVAEYPMTDTGLVGNSQAGVAFVATPVYPTTAWTEESITGRDFNGAAVADNNVTLVDRDEPVDNVFTFYYERKTDTRQSARITVIHNYYRAGIGEDQLEGTLTEPLNFTPGDDADAIVWLGKEFAATLRPIYEDMGYTFTDATHEFGEGDAQIVALFEGADGKMTAVTVNDYNGQTITINYRRVSGDTTYTVIHEYYSNGSLVGNISAEYGGTADAELDTTTIPRVPNYEGRNYTYGGINPGGTIVLSENPEENIIVITYNRSTSSGGSYTVTVNYYLEGTTTKLADSVGPNRLTAGSSYNVTDLTLLEIAGYTRTTVTGTVQGYLNSNVVVNVYYRLNDGPPPPDVPDDPDEPIVIIVPEEDPPLGDMRPEDGVIIIDENAPLGNLPQTSSANLVSPAAVLLMFFGIFGLGISFFGGWKRETWQ